MNEDRLSKKIKLLELLANRYREGYSFILKDEIDFYDEISLSILNELQEIGQIIHISSLIDGLYSPLAIYIKAKSLNELSENDKKLGVYYDDKKGGNSLEAVLLCREELQKENPELYWLPELDYFIDCSEYIENLDGLVNALLQKYAFLFKLNNTFLQYQEEEYRKNYPLIKNNEQKLKNNKINLIISRSEGIYRIDRENHKFIYSTKGKRLKLLLYLKDDKNNKDGNTIANEFYNNDIKLLSKEKTEINNLFLKKLNIKESIYNINIDKEKIEKDYEIIIRNPTSGYDLNHKKYNIEFK